MLLFDLLDVVVLEVEAAEGVEAVEVDLHEVRDVVVRQVQLPQTWTAYNTVITVSVYI